MLYACAQKNAGIAGVTVAVIRRDLLERSQEELPAMLNYRTFVEKGSRPNTPPVFAVYILGLVCEWILKDVGGLEHIAARNAEPRRVRCMTSLIPQKVFSEGMPALQAAQL